MRFKNVVASGRIQCAAFALAAMLPMAQANGRSIVGLGVLTGHTNSYPAAISPDGLTVVGRSELAPQGSVVQRRAFTWSAAGGMQSLGTFADSQSSIIATAVSGTGVIVGEAIIDGTGGLGRRAFRYTQGGGLAELTESPGMTPRAISADGTTIVGSGFAPFSGQQPVFVRNGVLTAIPGIDGADNSGFSDGQGAYGVNADGSVIVGRTTRFSFRQAVAFRWTAATGALAIASPATRAVGVSADGNVVAADFGGVTGSPPLLWSASGTQSLSGASGLWGGFNVAGMSALGDAVVGDFNNGIVPRRAFLWTPALGTVDLNAYLPTIGLSLAGWELDYATAISADGTRIAGYGRRTIGPGQSRIEGFLITIPGPGTGGAALMMAVLGWTRRRARAGDQAGSAPSTPAMHTAGGHGIACVSGRAYRS